MPLSLHAAFVPSALQMLGTTRSLVDKAESWCSERACKPAELLEAKLADDMLPFAYQVKSVAAHTAGAIDGLRAGVFSPDVTPPPGSFEALRAALDKARAALESVGEDELETLQDGPMRFEFREYRMEFTAGDFLLSFSQPNFYFHASAAYAILRMKGLPVGKRDFMGAVRLKQS